jgi:hypothetical protein
MKKIFPSVFLLFFFAMSFAQDFKIGVTVEPQITWLSPEAKDVKKDGNFFGINGGLIIDKYFQKNYAIHTGLSLGIQGGGLKFDNPSTISAYDSTATLQAGTTVDYNLHYLSVPLGLKLRTNQIGYFSYFVLIGFTNQINIKAKATTNDNSLTDDIITKEIYLYNLAYHIGLGADYALSKDTALTFGLVYNNGFLDLTKKNPKVKSRVLALRLGILF